MELGPSVANTLDRRVQPVSYQVVGQVIHHLLTDEDLRVRFAMNAVDTIAELMCRGCELTEEEIDVFVRTDARLWFWSSVLVGDRLH
jgi:hypothetical protein